MAGKTTQQQQAPTTGTVQVRMNSRRQAVPMSYERRLASYGLRDPVSGIVSGKQTAAQRKRIRKKIGHRMAKESRD